MRFSMNDKGFKFNESMRVIDYLEYSRKKKQADGSYGILFLKTTL